jgi:anti-sigma regulatory factor (Ser/Thr protein kinase)
MGAGVEQVKVFFKCQREEIPGTVGVCLDQIRKKTESGFIDDSLYSRVKWVIAELLTNAVKHSGQEESCLVINIGEESLMLEKEDFGKPLVLTGQDCRSIMWPLENLALPIDFPIYHNGMDSLFVRADQAGKATFFVEELPEMAMPGLLSDISEHFGLLIMTKASDAFTYEYDMLNGVNRFVCLFDLKKR